MNKIPKKIHYCWFGGKNKSKVIINCINSWKKMCPDYEIIEWNERNFDINSNLYVKQAYDNQKWAFVSDYVRLYVVYNFGGIYLDTDVKLIKSLDGLLENKVFFALEEGDYINTGLGFGAQKNNYIVKMLLDSYNEIAFEKNESEFDLTPCPVRNTNDLMKLFDCQRQELIYINDNEITILSKDYFSPFNPSTGEMNKTNNTVGIHLYNGSWRKKSMNLKEKILRPLKRTIGVSEFEELKKILIKNNKKNIGIVTIFDNDNYGNRLQNYALYKYLIKLKQSPINLIESKNSLRIRNLLKFILRKKYKKEIFSQNRLLKFQKFTNMMDYSDCLYGLEKIKIKKSIDKGIYKYIVGSDQVWNVGKRGINSRFLLEFANPCKRVAYSASFGVSDLDNKFKKKASKSMSEFKNVSLREETGKKIYYDITGKEDAIVCLDPTMLLKQQEWDKVSNRPKQLDNLKSSKYILNYFLGELSKERKDEINRIAKENNCEIINILDKNNPFYETGPSEFLYLEKNAFLICTDSFHSSVFAILYNTPFVVFDREDKVASMNSRIECLLSKFKLTDRYYKGKITDNLLKCDYTEAYKILEEERKKSDIFLRKALDIDEEDTDE